MNRGGNLFLLATTDALVGLVLLEGGQGQGQGQGQDGQGGRGRPRRAGAAKV